MYLKGLTPVQAEVVNEQVRNCCVIAVPGSGKTRVITAKLAALLDNGRTATAVTFTAESGHELRKRMSDMGLSDAQLSRLETGTFHALTWKRLKALQPDCAKRRIAKAGQCRTLMGRAIEIAIGGGISDDLIVAVEAARGRPDPLSGDVEVFRRFGFGTNELRGVMAEAINAYTRLMQESGLIDFTEIMWRGLELLRGWRGPYLYATEDGAPERQSPARVFAGDHVLVDEVQDVDAVQSSYMLLHHTQLGLAVDVVGDDDQAIYAFRGSQGIQAVREFAATTDAAVYTMDLNFRCRAEILRWAGYVIEQNKVRADKQLIAHRGAGGKVKFVVVRDDKFGTELELVAGWIRKDLESMQEGTVAVLGRTNRDLRRMELVLQEAKIDYALIGTKSMWDDDPVCLWVQALAEIRRKGMGHGLRALLYWCGCNDPDLRKLGAGLQSGRLWELNASSLDLSPKGASVINHLAPAWRSVARADWNDLPKASAALEDSAMAVAGTCGWSSIAAKSEELTAAIMKTAAESLGRLNGGLEDRVDLVLGPERKKREEQARVKLVSMHSSKGLEFERVYIIRALEKQIPGKTQGDAGLEEERRVLYVAMTRAKDSLTISYTESEGSPCPFLLGLNPPLWPVAASMEFTGARDMWAQKTAALTG